MGLSSLSCETTRLARLDPRTFRSRVWGVKRWATNASLKPYSTGIIHNLSKVCSPLFSCKFVKMSVCFKCNWPAVFSTWADGREWEFIPRVEGGKMFVQFLKVSYRVLNFFTKSCYERTGRGKAQYFLFHTAWVRFNYLLYRVLSLGATVLTKTNL